MTAVNENVEPVLFDELANRLTELGGEGHPSEIHGFLCGQLTAGSRLTARKWLEQVAEQLGDKTLDQKSEDVLSRLVTFLPTTSISVVQTLLFPI